MSTKDCSPGMYILKHNWWLISGGGGEGRRAETSCLWCCRETPIADQTHDEAKLFKQVCTNCRELYEHEYGSPLSEDDRMLEGFCLLKGDYDEKNTIDTMSSWICAHAREFRRSSSN